MSFKEKTAFALAGQTFSGEQLPDTHLEIKICGGGCPYWQQAGTTDYKKCWCVQPSQLVCQLRMVSILSYPFFRCFYFLRTSKNRNTWNNWPSTGFCVFRFDFLDKNQERNIEMKWRRPMTLPEFRALSDKMKEKARKMGFNHALMQVQQ